MKNNNKLFASLLALTLSATMCMSLAACGETNDNDGKNNDNGNNEANANAAYVVTKEEWEAALDFTNKNCTVQVAWSIPGSSEATGGLSAYLIDGQDAWTEMDGEWEKDSKEIVATGLDEGYTFYASKVYNFFAYDETTHSYKSTGSWYTYLAELLDWSEEGEEVEDKAQYVGEVKFRDKKLVSCEISLMVSNDARGSYTTTITNYGTTVKPAEAPAEE